LEKIVMAGLGLDGTRKAIRNLEKLCEIDTE